MLRLSAFVVGVCLCTSTVVRADESAGHSPSLTDDEKDALFAARVAKAERASLAGHIDDAAAAYRAALDLYPDPIIKGRLGLMLVKLGQVDKAAQELHEAVTRGQGAGPLERQEVLAAYDKARAATTWVNVNISHAGTKVTCDDSARNPEGFSSFWMFAMPGEHTLRATLDGYSEAVQTFTAKPGDEITITLNLTPDETALRKKRREFPPYIMSSNVATDANYSRAEDPFYEEPKDTKPAKKPTGTRFSVSGGVVSVFGVASWNPAIGAVLGVGLRPKEFLSLGLEARAAWLTTGVGGAQISAMTAGGLISLCGHVKWFFACPLGHLGVIRTEGAEATFRVPPFNFLRPGFGGRLGVRFRPMGQFDLQATAEAIALTRPTRVFVGSEMIVDQPAVLIGAQITGGWEF